MHGLIIGLKKTNLFFYLTNSMKSHEHSETPLLKVIEYPFLCDFKANILYPIKVDVKRKKKQPKVSRGLGEKWWKIIVDVEFRKDIVP